MPENTEAMPEISASPAPQDAKPADTGEKKQKKQKHHRQQRLLRSPLILPLTVWQC